MMRSKQCDRCFESATIRVTDVLPGSFAESQFCEGHEPREYRQTICSLCHAILDNPRTREAAVSMISSQLGVDRSRVLKTLLDGVVRLDSESD